MVKYLKTPLICGNTNLIYHLSACLKSEESINAVAGSLSSSTKNKPIGFKYFRNTQLSANDWTHWIRSYLFR